MKIPVILLSVLFLLSIFEFVKVDAKHKRHSPPKKTSKLFSVGLPKLLVDYKDCFKKTESAKNIIKDFLSLFTVANFTVNFHLTTRDAPRRVRLNNTKELNLDETDFDIGRKTVFITHGFASSGDEDWVHDLADAFLNWRDVNVIAVDWSEGAQFANLYEKASQNTEKTGKEIAKLIKRISDTVQKTRPAKTFGGIHLVGHSLGAHVSAFAASQIKQDKISWKLDRITGLDPAQPCFFDVGEDHRLDASDAPFVDVIHTNIETDRAGFGMPGQVGHLDFYPNGGAKQPGCEENFLDTEKMACNHGRSYLYLTDSLLFANSSSCTFKAFKWDLEWQKIPSKIDMEQICAKKSCIEMGINSEKYKDSYKGTFFTITGSTAPFCKIDQEDKREIKSIVKAAKKGLNNKSKKHHKQ